MYSYVYIDMYMCVYEYIFQDAYIGGPFGWHILTKNVLHIYTMYCKRGTHL